MLVTQSSRYRFAVLQRLLPICLGVLLCVSGAVAWGQQYTELNVDDTLKAQEGTVNTLIRGASLNATQQQQVNDFFTKYSFPRWTRLSDGGELPNYRRDLVDDIRRAQGGTKDYMLQMTFTYFKGVAESNVAWPPTRYNAMLLLGELNQAEGATSSAPPTTYAPSVPVLIQTLQDGNAPDFLRLAALIGLERHAYVGIADAAIRDNQVLPLLLSIIEAEIPTGNRSEDVHNWFRWRAIRALGNAGLPGANDKYLIALGQMGMNPELDPPLRYAALRALGFMDYTLTQNVKPEHLIGMMSNASLQVIQDEMDAINERIMASQAGTGGMGGYGGDYGGDYGSDYGGGYGMQDEGGYGGMGGGASRDITDSKRRVLYGFGSVLNALKGSSSGREGIQGFIVETVDEDNADELIRIVNAFISFCDDNEFRMSETILVNELFSTRKEIEELEL